MKPVVAIVGRPNVGKSTLFNRLLGERKAIVHDMPGVTRDRNYGDATWFGRTFSLVDTGGFEPRETEGMLPLMREQATLAIEEADVVLLVLDARAGVTASDREIFDVLRKSHKPLLVLGNKVEGRAVEAEALALYEIGVDVVYPVSAEHGTGIYDMLEALVEGLPPEEGGEHDGAQDGVVRIAVVGKPNVGKSSLINCLLGQPRLLASDVPGTTRDSIDTALEHDGRNYVLIDTAGIRRKRAVSLRVERFSVLKALRSVERADVAVLMLDANNGVTGQDAKLASLIADRGRAVVIVVNKWDTIEKETETAGEFVKELRRQLPFFTYAPVVFTSALSGQRVLKVLELAERVHENASRRISTGVLNRVFEELTERHPPPVYRGRRIRFYYVSQVAVAPPTVVCSVNAPEGIQPSYTRFLMGQLREQFDFEGTPLRIFYRQRGQEESAGKSKGRRKK